MSRIFEALQHSESERFSLEFPQAADLANQVLQAAQSEQHDLGSSKSLPVSVLPESRLVSLTNRDSLGAEKFRFLAVRLRQLQQNGSLKKVLVTSTIPEEGKSVVSANLAVALASKKQKVLLLEGDMRRPVLAQQFGLGKLPGLCEWLRNDAGAPANIYHLESADFWFLPAGRPPENPLELMQSGRLADLLAQLTASFDWIVIDSPPVLPLADASVWTKFVDGVLLVAREGKTEKRELKRGLQALEQCNLLGVVLNGCSSTAHSNYYHRYGPGASPSPVGAKEDQ